MPPSPGCVKVYIVSSTCNSSSLSFMSVGMIGLLHFLSQWCDCIMRFGEYGAFSVERYVPCVHYETSGSPLPSPVTQDYMDQILNKENLYGIVYLMPFLHPFYFPVFHPFPFSHNFYFFLFHSLFSLLLQGQYCPEESHLFPG